MKYRMYFNTKYKTGVEDMENLGKKNQTENPDIKSPFSQTKNTVEGYLSRLIQVGDRISDLEN
jgi:hypothetical protein